MNGRRATVSVLWLGVMVSPVFGQTAGMFSFQGLIKDAGGNPVNGNVDLEFRIYDAETLGNLVDMNGNGVVEDVMGLDAKQVLGVAATNGIVSTQFGPVHPSAFDGTERWLELSVDGSPLSRVEMVTAPATAEQVNIPLTGTPAVRVEPSGDPFYESPNLIGGHPANSVDPGVAGATIAGGGVATSPNQVTSNFGTVGGGLENIASGLLSTVGGGENNTASGSGVTVGGGSFNAASGFFSTVGGGEYNTASGSCSTVGGGSLNSAGGACSVCPGGCFCFALGVGSFAAGTGANALHDGSFVWADNSTDQVFSSKRDNEFCIRATGGTELVSAVDEQGNAIASVTLEPGANAWTTLSSRTAKTNFEPVDARGVLERLATVPIETWNYKTQDASILHMGPMADDFCAAFGLGDSDKSISTIDTDGVALAAIQGLYELQQQKDACITEQQSQIATLEARLAEAQAERDETDVRLTALEELVANLSRAEEGGSR